METTPTQQIAERVRPKLEKFRKLVVLYSEIEKLKKLIKAKNSRHIPKNIEEFLILNDQFQSPNYYNDLLQKAGDEYDVLHRELVKETGERHQSVELIVFAKMPDGCNYNGVRFSFNVGSQIEVINISNNPILT